jgi:hypothetical protein
MTNVLPYHVGPEDRYSLEFVNLDREEFKQHLAERTTERGSAFKSRKITIETEDGIEPLYAVYCSTVPESILEEQTVEDVERVLETEFSPDQIQVLDVIFEVFSGITETV